MKPKILNFIFILLTNFTVGLTSLTTGAATPTHSVAINRLPNNEGKYRCVIIDPAIGSAKADENVFVLYQRMGVQQAKYIGKTAVLDFKFNDSPLTIRASDPQTGQEIEFSQLELNHRKLDGIIANLEIEIHCKKR